jgi:NADH-quinone oxidoreductase subunit J
VSAVLFFIAAVGAIAGATGVVMLRDPFYSVLALVVHLICLAILFLLLRAEFVAAVQVVVYAGAVMVLYVFVVAYIGGEGARSALSQIGDRLGGSGPVASGLRLGGAVLGVALAIELLIALLGTGLKAVEGHGAPYAPGPRTFGTPAYIGQLLLTRFLVAFEIASFLLLIAAVGGVVLARRRGGLEDLEERARLTPLDLVRPRGVGTTAEAVGTFGGAGRLEAPAASRAAAGAGESGAGAEPG